MNKKAQAVVIVSAILGLAGLGFGLKQANKIHKLNLDIITLQTQLENVESANDVLTNELTKLIGGR